ncbi:hypothetical protein BDB00DRAFT_919049 [Zychaea mexicana]|uniref:uncharacterized protein n=1 Tax=Zychaea mexicana TaxID=64656 RepID=UPI0022FE3AD6|nr:uncharacterized protein BDB00DRAFT_919049 [Zychaea mexicana]KAI9497728.1 hypothetical protein BDB00DRAFT_919049 [Zychaea mexicana]
MALPKRLALVLFSVFLLLSRYPSPSPPPPPPPYFEPNNPAVDEEGEAGISTMYYYSSIDMIRAAHYDPKNPFAFSADQLGAVVEKRDLKYLNDVGGVLGMAKGLHSDIMQGLPDDERYLLRTITLNDLVTAASSCNKSTTSSDDDDDDDESDILDEDMVAYDVNNLYQNHDVDGNDSIATHHQRKAVFGRNVLPCVQHKSLLRLIWTSLQDKTLILLIVAAVISLTVGIYEDLTTVEYDSSGNRIPGVKWVEGMAILFAIILVVLVGSINDLQKEKQFRRLNAQKEHRHIDVIRSGNVQLISVYDIQVGDVVRLVPGDIIAADGVFIQGSNVKCDESATTGESDAVRKARLQECLAWGGGKPPSSNTLVSSSSGNSNDNLLMDLHDACPDPFLISGSKVIEGEGTYLVTSVGVHSCHGKTMLAMRTPDEQTPLQQKLNVLAGNIAKFGVSAAGVVFIILLVRCVVSYSSNESPSVTASVVVSQIMHILITAVTVVVVAVPEGLPLAVTLALAYATQRMLKDNNLVRVLAACETMGNATTICSDKTGTLTQNTMAVVAGTFGSSFRFLRDPPASRGDLIDLTSIRYKIPLPVRNFINQAMALNSTVYMSTNAAGEKTLMGNKTETATLHFAQDYMQCEPFELLRTCWAVEHVYSFNSARKAMATVIRIPVLDEYTKKEKIIYRLHVKGASEMLLGCCSSIVSMHAQSYERFDGIMNGNSYAIETRTMTDANRARMAKIISSYATRCLRTLAFCYRDFDTWPPQQQKLEDILSAGDLTLLGIVGIEDPLRPGVKSAVAACQRAGVCVRMVTGDNMLTAKSIARQCGIYTPGGKTMDGPTFRQLTHAERQHILPDLQVLARSSPEDKRILVQSLRELGETVAVTGDGTNDGPALKAADVGFSMGLGTEVAKEASSIILMDDNFASIVRAISWGRCVNDSVKKFLQFQLTVNITAVVLTLVSAVVESKSVLTAVQLLWVNLIMDTFAALALATDPPTPQLLERLPEARTAPLIHAPMWKMICGQSIYQITVILSLMYTDLLHLDTATLETVVFTAFVFCQIFNEVNSRRIDNRFNVVKGITKNKFFVLIFVVTLLGQFVIVECGGSALQTVPLNAKLWGVCILIGVMSLPVGALIRLVPDELFFSHTAPVYHVDTVSRPPAIPPRDDDVDERLAWHAVPRQHHEPLATSTTTTRTPSEKGAWMARNF